LAAETVDEAVQRALDLGAGRIIICGSLYLAGEVLGASEDTWPV
jgi:dihydrofolate synthase/folylpolyglutamate synthase